MRRWHSSFAARARSGTAQLVFDGAADLYHCYWLVGPCADQLMEHAKVATAAEAVGWAAARTPKARIRLPNHRTYWAGSDPDPGGFAGRWQSLTPVSRVTGPRSEQSQVSSAGEREPVGVEI